MPREVISIHIGQAGCQLAGVIWELYCREHCLDADGKPTITPKTMKTSSNLQTTMDHLRPEITSEASWLTFRDGQMDSSPIAAGFPSFFIEMSEGNYSPRAVLVDLEPSVIDEIRSGYLKNIFSPFNCVKGTEDAANNYARGHYSSGPLLLDRVQEPVRKMAEASEKLQGFMYFHSFGGGSGSGFTSLLSEVIDNDYTKQSKLGVAIFPSPTMSTAVVEPYNAVLSSSYTMGLADCTFLFDNEAMYNICQGMLDVDSPTYRNLNHLLAQTVSSLTSSLRFQGTLNADFSDFQTNLVPFPRIHYPIVSYAPIVSNNKCSHQILSINDITSKCFDSSNRLVNCDADSGYYMSCCLLYRGDVSSKDVNFAITQIKNKKTIRFVHWSPTGFKIGINSSPPLSLKASDMSLGTRAACMVGNTTAIKEAWTGLNNKYHTMLMKKAFTHWYLAEGMDSNEFYEAQENLLILEEEYTLLLAPDL